MAEAESLADRVGILDQGRLLALEAPDALRRRYAADTLEEAFLNATGKALEAEEVPD
jgi:ABC-2 type transport system ATP-binding protein